MIVTPAKKVTQSIKIKRSEFFGFLYPIAAPADVPENIKKLKKQFPKARHICWAYRVQLNGVMTENSSDAGEPAGTAGLPILHVLKSNNMAQCALLVVRIFGGIKLGKRGLIDAYGACATETISHATLIRWEEKIRLVLEGSKHYYSEFYHLVEQYRGTVIADYSSVEVKWLIEIPLLKEKSFTKTVCDQLAATVWREE